MPIRTTKGVKPVAASMSSRRRAARKIEALHRREVELLEAIRMDRALMEQMGHDNRKLRDEIEEAKRIAGRMSILFPAEPVKLDMKAPVRGDRESVNVDIAETMPVLPWDTSTPIGTMTRRAKSLDLLVAEVHPDSLRQAVHFEARFADGLVRYSIDRRDLMMMSDRDAVSRVEHNIAPALARGLVQHLRKVR